MFIKQALLESQLMLIDIWTMNVPHCKFPDSNIFAVIEDRLDVFVHLFAAHAIIGSNINERVRAVDKQIIQCHHAPV